MKEIGTLMLLGINAWTDWKRKQIFLPAVFLYGVLGLGNSLWSKREMWDLFMSLGVGCLFIGLSVLTKGDIGLGDGWILLALGTVLEMEEYLPMLCLGLLLAAFCAAVLLTVGKQKRNTEIPFVPFLLMGYVGGLCL